jgi:hypothetical protein
MKSLHAGARDLQDLIQSAKHVLESPCYLVIFGDNATIPILKEMRENYGLTKLTVYHEVRFEDLWCYPLLDKVKENRELYWPTKDERTSSETHLICCNKFDFVLKTMEENPFQTSKFGWIDCFTVKPDGTSKIAEDYNPYRLLYVLHNITDKFHLQILNVVDKKYILDENKREYYNQYRWLVCGSLFTCSKEIGTPILNRLKENVVKTTELGYGHGEEMLYLEILDEFYDDIVRGYGDYGQILNNFIKPTKNIAYVIYVLDRFIEHQYYREAYDCSKALLGQLESFELWFGWKNHFDILFKHYISCYHYIPTEAISILERIHVLKDENPYMEQIYQQNKLFYTFEHLHR